VGAQSWTTRARPLRRLTSKTHIVIDIEEVDQDQRPFAGLIGPPPTSSMILISRITRKASNECPKQAIAVTSGNDSSSLARLFCSERSCHDFQTHVRENRRRAHRGASLWLSYDGRRSLNRGPWLFVCRGHRRSRLLTVSSPMTQFKCQMHCASRVDLSEGSSAGMPECAERNLASHRRPLRPC
jgi:hypothetical protein